MEAYYGQQIKDAERAESLAYWKVKRCLLTDARKQYIMTNDWSPQQEKSELFEPKEMEENVHDEDIMIKDRASKICDVRLPHSDQSPDSDILNRQHIDPHRSIPRHQLTINMESNKQTVDEGNVLGLYSSRNDRTPVKESPNQECSSVSDMTASLMSTSSDFVETPFDENIPDFEVDPKKSTNMEKTDVENRIYAYAKSSIESVLYDRPEVTSQRKERETISSLTNKIEALANKQRVFLEEYGLESSTVEGAHSLTEINADSQYSSNRILEDSMLNLKLTAEMNRNKILREEYGILEPLRETEEIQDNNANFSVTKNIRKVTKDDENGNKEEVDHLRNNTFNANANSDSLAIVKDTVSLTTPEEVDEGKDPNANINTVADELCSSLKTFSKEDAYFTTSVIHTNTSINRNINNGNTIFQNRNELVSEFKERKAQAAAIKQKILNEEYHPSMTKKNTINILRSKPLPSSAATKNKQKVLEVEYAMSVLEAEELENRENSEKIDGHGIYSRQVSGTSTASYKSCSTYDRQTSDSTAFTTPEEEIKPILIDQVK